MAKKTDEKLRSLQNIRHTPIENLVESIVASAMQKDEKYWHKLENSKHSIPNIRNEKKSFIQGMKYIATLKRWANSTKSALKIYINV